MLTNLIADIMKDPIGRSGFGSAAIDLDLGADPPEFDRLGTTGRRQTP
jgi:hypothetical protein